MDFGELLDQEKRAQWDRAASREKARAEYQEVLERWSSGVAEFMRLSLPTVQFGWVSRENRRAGLLSRRTETEYRFHGLGEGWLLQEDVMGDRERSGARPIFLATNGDLYGDIWDTSGLEDVGTTYVADGQFYSKESKQRHLVGVPAGSYCALMLINNEQPLPSPPKRPDEALKLLASYAAART